MMFSQAIMVSAFLFLINNDAVFGDGGVIRFESKIQCAIGGKLLSFVIEYYEEDNLSDDLLVKKGRSITYGNQKEILIVAEAENEGDGKWNNSMELYAKLSHNCLESGDYGEVTIVLPSLPVYVDTTLQYTFNATSKKSGKYYPTMSRIIDNESQRGDK